LAKYSKGTNSRCRGYENTAMIEDWMSIMGEKRSGAEPIKESEITHFIPYREEIATSDQVLSDRETWRDFEPVAEWLERFLPTASEQRLPVSLSETKGQILQEIQFSAGTTEYQDKDK